MRLILFAAPALALIGCNDSGAANDAAATNETLDIPESLAPFGDGYPASGDPCRQLGESEATANYLDDSALLVGCPDTRSAEALGGKVVDTIEGITLVSVPMGDANAGMGENGPASGQSEDALVAGTEYNATGPVKCGFGGNAPNQTCQAGVKRNWGEDGTHLVEVTKADGSKRAIFFNGNVPTGADSAQADGSAGWDFSVKRNDRDESIISFGPETYVIPDMMPLGG